MFVKPREGLVVRDPVSKRPLPAEGAEVPETGYWFRRLRDNDVVEAKPPKAAAEPAVTLSPGAARSA